MEGEIASKEARKIRSTTRSRTWSDAGSNRESTYSGHYLVNNRSTTTQKLPLDYDESSFNTPISAGKSFPPMMEMSSEDSSHSSPRHSSQPIRPNRRIGEDVELGGIGGAQLEFSMPPTRSRATLSSVNPAVHQFRSPIGLSLSLVFPVAAF